MLKRAIAILSLVANASQGATLGPPLPPQRPAEFAPPSHAAAPPFPPPRPANLPPASALAYAPAPSVREATPNAAPSAAEDAACEMLLASGAAIAARVTPVSGENGCGIAAPVSLKAIVLADRRRIELVPNPVMRCDLAAAIARWIAEDVAPLAEKNGERIVRLVNADSYDCRGRNRQAGAKLSEHGKGDALDVTAIEFADGRATRLADRRNDPDMAASLRASACSRFTTVLGPGSDGFHEDHVHLDLAARHNGGKICQWELR